MSLCDNVLVVGGAADVAFVQTGWKLTQVVALQPLEVEQISPAAHGGPHGRADGWV